MTNLETAKKDLLLVNAGGTASQERQLDLTLVRLSAEEIANRIHPDITRNRTIGTIDLWPAINSSDITSREHMQYLAKKVAEWREEYRAIGIIMGANSAPYVGSYLALSLGRGLDIIPGIGSGQRHQGRMGSDSMGNVNDLCRILLEGADLGVREVGLYSGSNNRSLLRAVGAEKASDNSFSIYQSPNIPPLAEITAHETRFSKQCRRGIPTEPFQLRNEFTLEGIIPLRIQPDFDPNYIEAVAGIDGCRAIVMETYETGNLPDHLLKAVGRVVSKGAYVIIVPSFNEPNLTYRMPKEEQNAVMVGAVAAPGNMAKPALYTKIGYWLSYNNEHLKGMDLGRFLDEDYVGEIPDRDELTMPSLPR